MKQIQTISGMKWQGEDWLRMAAEVEREIEQVIKDVEEDQSLAQYGANLPAAEEKVNEPLVALSFVSQQDSLVSQQTEPASKEPPLPPCSDAIDDLDSQKIPSMNLKADSQIEDNSTQTESQEVKDKHELSRTDHGTEFANGPSLVVQEEQLASWPIPVDTGIGVSSTEALDNDVRGADIAIKGIFTEPRPLQQASPTDVNQESCWRFTPVR